MMSFLLDSFVTRFLSLVIEVATFLHACEGDAVSKLSQEKVPYFNAPIYLENKTQIGKVDEIFGPINESVSSLPLLSSSSSCKQTRGFGH